MKSDPQAERAFGSLIERETKRKAARDLENAHAEILRLRKKQTSLLGCIEVMLKDPPADFALCLSETVEKYKNEY
jgi:hypothetical protein